MAYPNPAMSDAINHSSQLWTRADSETQQPCFNPTECAPAFLDVQVDLGDALCGNEAAATHNTAPST